ncbi:hypothetical protein [Streptomyces cinerochromogenes]|uniref:hypothetical protein n=1 Tax=Streptomyces cinerochromogenes TaxID=66422 RepID=UPI00167008EC|nr:hypothetical protein [Streptomyces cinerochromogenes]GGS82940.1 hypothetical protein GCM10010206_51890 [Streptomyces cinerochromogenes]
MTKKLDTSTITNELEGSVFFSQKPASSDKNSVPVVTSDAHERPNGRSPERSFTRRIVTRNSFEVYEDQMDDLRRLAYAEKMAGKIGSMSAMVRDAIDHYLKDHPVNK